MTETVPSYTFDDIILMLENIGDWIFFAGLLIVPVMLIIGGIMLLTAGGDPTKVATARKLFMWTIVGLALMLVSKGVFAVMRSIFGG